MKKSCDEFRRWPTKAVTLLGMSGVGKTTLARILPSDTWFHYSGDYRIGTRYLNEDILDFIKRKAMQDETLRELLKRDAIYIRNNITVNNLEPISLFVGKIGNPDADGLSVEEFKRRQKRYHAAEVRAMQDVEDFMWKAENIYGYPNFLNDAGGSVCGLSDEECWTMLAEKTLVLYLHASDDMEHTLLERAKSHPKPMLYDEKFLDTHLAWYMETNKYNSSDEIDPDSFVQWVFPKLIAYRKPLYENLAERYGHTIEAERIFELRDEADFIELVCDATNGG